MRKKILLLTCVFLMCFSLSIQAQQEPEIDQDCYDLAVLSTENEIGWGWLSFLHWDYAEMVSSRYEACVAPRPIITIPVRDNAPI
jgi:hypothetical protein